MVNLRYHIVSLVAVFLALAVGVIAGTTVIDQGLVRSIERQRADDRARADTLNERNEGLERELTLWNQFGQLVAGPLVDGQLAGRAVVLVATEDVPEEVRSAVEDIVAEADAEAAGLLTFTRKWSLEGATALEQLQVALSSLEDEPARLLQEAAARLAERMRAPADPDVEGDLLGSLVQAGFVTITGNRQTGFPPRDALAVVLSGGAPEPLVPRDTFTLPFLRALSTRTTVAVAEPLGAQESLADRVRSDDELGASVATVDHVDTIPGRIALVAALAELASDGRAKHYGVRGRTNGVAPAFGP